MSVSFTDLVAFAGPPSSVDLLAFVRVSDFTQSPDGSTLKITIADLFTNPTISTGLTVTGPIVSGAITSSGAISASSFVGALTGAVTGNVTGNLLGNVTGNLTGTTVDVTAGITAASVAVTGAITGASAAVTGAVAVTGAITAASVAVTAGLTSSGPTGAGIGYATGAGGAVTQVTSRFTSVTLNTLSGVITTDVTSLAQGAAASFTVNNSTVAIGDVPVVAIRSGATNPATFVDVSTVTNGSFKITVQNPTWSTGNEVGSILINFAVIKAVSA